MSSERDGERRRRGPRRLWGLRGGAHPFSHGRKASFGLPVSARLLEGRGGRRELRHRVDSPSGAACGAHVALGNGCADARGAVALQHSPAEGRWRAPPHACGGPPCGLASLLRRPSRRCLGASWPFEQPFRRTHARAAQRRARARPTAATRTRAFVARRARAVPVRAAAVSWRCSALSVGVLHCAGGGLRQSLCQASGHSKRRQSPRRGARAAMAGPVDDPDDNEAERNKKIIPLGACAGPCSVRKGAAGA